MQFAWLSRTNFVSRKRFTVEVPFTNNRTHKIIMADLLGVWTDVHTLLYLKLITNKDQLYSRRNSAQHPVII